MKTSIQSIALAVASYAFVGSAFANDAVGPGDSDSRWVAGGSTSLSSNIYAGEKDENSLSPNIRYNGDRFFVKDGTLNVSIMTKDDFSFGLTAAPSGSFLSEEKEYRNNEKLAGLEERGYTVEAGFYVNHTTDLGRLNFTFVSDLGNEHDGQTALVSYTFDLRAGGWYINPVVGAAWLSGDKADYLFGVSEAEATDSREAYDADSSLSVFAGVRGRYELTKNWDVELSAGYVALADEISDSSIVDDDYAYSTSVGINYNF